jgi:hypothetical protein
VDSNFEGTVVFQRMHLKGAGDQFTDNYLVIGKGDSARTALARCRGFDNVSFDRLYEARDRRVPHPALTARPSKWPRP